MRSVAPILKAGTSSFRYRCIAASVRHACNVIGTLPSPEIDPIAAIIMVVPWSSLFPIVEQLDERGGPGVAEGGPGGSAGGVLGRPCLRDGYWLGAWEGTPMTGSLSDPVPTPPPQPHCSLDARPVGMGSSGGDA